MKKTIIISLLAITLFSGCGEDETLKKGKIQFERDTVTLGYVKAQTIAETSFPKEQVELWIEDLKSKGKWFTKEQIKQELADKYKVQGGIHLNKGVRKMEFYPKYGEELTEEIFKIVREENKNVGGGIKF